MYVAGVDQTIGESPSDWKVIGDENPALGIPTTNRVAAAHTARCLDAGR